MDAGGHDEDHGCVGFWFVSFVWGWLTLLPHALGASAPKVENKVLRRSGLALFALGLATEVMADFQKFFFKRNHKGFCDVGLWSVSQHPNWFGNLCLWSGITLYNAPGLSPVKLALAAVSPVFLGRCLAPGPRDRRRPWASQARTARTRASPRIWRPPLFMRVDAVAALASGLVAGWGPGARHLGPASTAPPA